MKTTTTRQEKQIKIRIAEVKSEFEKVLKHLAEAHKILKDLEAKRMKSQSWRYLGDISFFKNEIAQIISSDDGEAGMEVLVKRWQD